MADVELVIKIPEEMAYRFKHEGEQRHYDYHTVLLACIEGIPLPKGHGDLIDRNKLVKTVITKFYTTSYFSHICEAVDDAPTIIEADKGDKE